MIAPDPYSAVKQLINSMKQWSDIQAALPPAVLYSTRNKQPNHYKM